MDNGQRSRGGEADDGGVHGARIAGAVRGSEANIGSGAFDGQLGLGAPAVPPGSFSLFDHSAVAGRGVVPVVLIGPQFLLHHEPRPGGLALAYPNDIGTASWRQLGPVAVVLVCPQLPGGVVPVQGNDGYYSALQPRPGPEARRGVVLGDLLTGGGGAVYNWDYALQPRPGSAHGQVLRDPFPEDAEHGDALQPRPGAGYGEVLVDRHLIPDGAGHGEVFVGLLPGGVDAGYDNYDYDALQPSPGAGHGEVFVGLLPRGGVAVHDAYGYYYPLQPRPGAGRGEVFVGQFPDGVGQTLLGTGSANEIAGALHDPNLVAGYGGSVVLADDLGDNRSMVAEHLRRLLPFAGIGAASVAINGFAAGPGSPAVAFHLLVLLLGGLFLVILHVLRV